jgi:tetratricopeptide (TPR) repeat protein
VRSLAVAIVLLASTVHADDRPWAAGVSAEAQQQALAAYTEANQLFDDGAYAKALAKYQAALALWDHPKIHYNTAVCLMNLDRTVEAYEQLEAALKYGPAPFEPAMYKQAQLYEKLLSGKVGELSLELKQQGAEVSLDGKVVLSQPGATSMHVLAGEPHQLVASKRDYETQTRAITLKPGEKSTLVIELHLLPAAKHVVRRWAKWKPWAVLAAGGAVAIAGGALALDGRSKIGSYDDAVNQMWTADMTHPPMPAPSVVDGKNTGVTETRIGIPALAIGGAIAAAGFVMVLANSPRVVTVAPALGKEQTGVTLVGHF